MKKGGFMEKLNDCFCKNKYTSALIEECLTEAKNLDPSVEILQKENEITVRKKGEVTRFRFSEKDGVIYVSFRGKTKQPLDRLSRMQILKMIKNVSNLPSSELKRKKRSGKTFSAGFSRYEFLNLLSKGIDPTTNTKVFIPSRDLTLALKSLNVFVLRYENIASTDFRIYSTEEEISAQEEKIRAQKRARQNVDDRSGILWTTAEDEQLKEEYNKGVCIEEIMRTHNRTRSAIERRLLKLVPLSEIKSKM